MLLVVSVFFIAAAIVSVRFVLSLIYMIYALVTESTQRSLAFMCTSLTCHLAMLQANPAGLLRCFVPSDFAFLAFLFRLRFFKLSSFCSYWSVVLYPWALCFALASYFLRFCIFCASCSNIFLKRKSMSHSTHNHI